MALAVSGCPRCGGPLYPLAARGWGCPQCAMVYPQHLPAPSPPEPEPEPPPKLTAKVIGFRTWALDGYKLMSGAGEWRMGVNTAECKRHLFEGPPWGGHPGHEAPEHSCTCGLYAWYEAEVLGWQARGTPVFGAITAWGHIEAQPRGFRAQYAEPVVLAYHEDQPYRHVRDLKAIASEMGVACVSIEELEAEALKHGQPVPRELIPEGGLALGLSALSGGAWGASMGFATGGIVPMSGGAGGGGSSGYRILPAPRRKPP